MGKVGLNRPHKNHCSGQLEAVMIKKLFVYGTLRPGHPNEHILKNIGGSWEKASVNGFVHEGNWGSALGYPAITLDKDGSQVDGFLFSSDAISEHWSYLDEFEGSAYKRVLTAVTLQNGTLSEAYIYALKRPTISG
jgi:gamma-glutamylcyclotransferase (GGCT)/AIG2-like uncharacterized protein YtfP